MTFSGAGNRVKSKNPYSLGDSTLSITRFNLKVEMQSLNCIQYHWMPLEFKELKSKK